jgi:hypothetical protein
VDINCEPFFGHDLVQSRAKRVLEVGVELDNRRLTRRRSDGLRKQNEHDRFIEVQGRHEAHSFSSD